MKTEIIAIIISCFSITIAALSLGWNIYRDVILKPKLKVSFKIGEIIWEGQKESIEKIILSVTNLGHGTIICSMIHWKNTDIYKQLMQSSTAGVIIHDYENPMSGKLPCKLDVGEKNDYLFSIDKECILEKGVTHIGMRDSFGRIHWAPKIHVKEVMNKYNNIYKNKK